jgi:hypothetical protein
MNVAMISMENGRYKIWNVAGTHFLGGIYIYVIFNLKHFRLEIYTFRSFGDWYQPPVAIPSLDNVPLRGSQGPGNYIGQV